MEVKAAEVEKEAGAQGGGALVEVREVALPAGREAARLLPLPLPLRCCLAPLAPPESAREVGGRDRGGRKVCGADERGARGGRYSVMGGKMSFGAFLSSGGSAAEAGAAAAAEVEEEEEEEASAGLGAEACTWAAGVGAAAKLEAGGAKPNTGGAVGAEVGGATAKPKPNTGAAGAEVGGGAAKPKVGAAAAAAGNAPDEEAEALHPMAAAGVGGAACLALRAAGGAAKWDGERFFHAPPPPAESSPMWSAELLAATVGGSAGWGLRAPQPSQVGTVLGIMPWHTGQAQGMGGSAAMAAAAAPPPDALLAPPKKEDAMSCCRGAGAGACSPWREARAKEVPNTPLPAACAAPHCPCAPPPEEDPGSPKLPGATTGVILGVGALGRPNRAADSPPAVAPPRPRPREKGAAKEPPCWGACCCCCCWGCCCGSTPLLLEYPLKECC